jgi:hypothetical protein
MHQINRDLVDSLQDVYLRALVVGGLVILAAVSWVVGW